MIDVHELWGAAEGLVARSLDAPGEALRRAAISRVYYAVFHAVLEGLPVRFMFNPAAGTGTHRQVIELLRSRPSPMPGAFAIAAQVERLFRLRVVADYQLAEAVARPDLDRALSLARNIRSQLRPLPD